MVGYADRKVALAARLNRIEGQVRGIAKMVDDDRYCIDVLNQITAVSNALKAVAVELVDGHLSHCIAEAIENGGDDAAEKVREASAAIARLVKS